MEGKREGSAIVMILLVITGIMLIATAALKSTMFLYDLALERVEHVRQMQALQALTHYAIAVSWSRRDSKDDHQYTESLAKWPTQKGKYQAQFTINSGDKTNTIKTQLLHKNNVICAIQCIVSAKSDGWKIEDWLLL